MGEGDRARNQDRADDRVVVVGREEGGKKKTNRDIRGREKELAQDPRFSL